MEQMGSTSGILNLMIQPAFTAKDGAIILVNEAAGRYFLKPGMPLSELLVTGREEYGELREGCLYLTLSISGVPHGASVRRMEEFDLFTLEQEEDQAELQSMALAAQQLRMPLSNVMTVAEQLFPLAAEGEDPVIQEQIAKMNRGLFQMLRMIGNMSDAYRYNQPAEPKLVLQNVTAVVGEIFEKTANLLEHGGVPLSFTNINKAVFSLVDSEKLERAAYNLISNAVKFTGKGGCVEASLVQRKNMLYLTVLNRKPGENPNHQGNIHARYLRKPGMEDSRFGIGLGMVMIRAAAAVHGGTVLVDYPEECCTRITMSMKISQDVDQVVRMNSMSVDYAGERDHSLVELADVLPYDLYRAEKIN
ncbi:MAG: HAMP domain-containing histidine kinase [Ruminococcaceae bacterium]|nr:HAMP domain-containing histidine kinase [Oscillospiraceae bacterium]